MKIVKLDSIIEICAVVRTAQTLLYDLVLKLRNETTDTVIDVKISWVFKRGRLRFFFEQPEDFSAGNKYEIEIKNEFTNDIVYRGKLLVVTEDTDIQNYTPSKQQTQRFKTKD